MLLAGGWGVFAIVTEWVERTPQPEPFTAGQMVDECVESLQTRPRFSETGISPDGVCRCAVKELVTNYTYSEMEQMGKDGLFDALVDSLDRCRELLLPGI